MSSEFGPWDNNSQGSDTDLNKETIPHLTGDTIATLQSIKFGLVKCIETESGGSPEFFEDHLYASKADGTGWVDLTQVPIHRHNGPTEGGSFFRLFTDNPLFVDTGHYYLSHMKTDDWVVVESGSGDVEDHTDYPEWDDKEEMKLVTNGTNGSGASIRLAGLHSECALNGYFQTLVGMHHETNMFVNIGRNMENPTASEDLVDKFGFTFCTSVNTKWWVRTADGATDSNEDTNVEMGVDEWALKAIHDIELSFGGTPTVYFYIDGTLVVEKTDDVPGGGSYSPSNMFRFGVKNTEALTKNVSCLAMRMGYYVDDQWY